MQSKGLARGWFTRLVILAALLSLLFTEADAW
jgi:hypothetical protein